MSVRIRAVTPEDFPQLFALDQACFEPGIAYSKAELRYFLRYPRNVALVAEGADGANGADSGIAGFAIGGMERRGGQLAGRLITIDVREEWRRRGVGHALIEAVEEQLRRAGAAALFLEVAADNGAAQEFYVRHGFARTGRIPGYYLGRIDALVMEKRLV